MSFPKRRCVVLAVVLLQVSAPGIAQASDEAEWDLGREILSDSDFDAALAEAQRAGKLIEALWKTAEGRDLLGEEPASLPEPDDPQSSAVSAKLDLTWKPLQVYEIAPEALEECKQNEPPPDPETLLTKINKVVYRVSTGDQLIAFVSARKADDKWKLVSVGGQPHLERLLEDLEKKKQAGENTAPLYLVEVPSMYQLFAAVAVIEEDAAPFGANPDLIIEIAEAEANQTINSPDTTEEEIEQAKEAVRRLKLRKEELFGEIKLVGAVNDERFAEATGGELGVWGKALWIEDAFVHLWKVCREWEGALARTE